MARFRSLQRATLLLVFTLLLSSSSVDAAAATTTTTTAESYSSRKLLLTAARTSPATLSPSSRARQDMHVGGWRRMAPFRRPGASLGRRVPGSHANPSHN